MLPKVKKSISLSHQNPPTDLFSAVSACKRCLICADFSPDSVFLTGESNIADIHILVGNNSLKLKCLNDVFVS